MSPTASHAAPAPFRALALGTVLATALSSATAMTSLPAMATSLPSASAGATGDVVFLVHGLGRTPLSLRWLGRQLEEAGYETVDVPYRSRHQTIEASAGELARVLAASDTTGRRVHFVTHSLGGLVVRSCLRGHRPATLGRVVMLAPPNQGSELADCLARNPVFRLATGPAGQQIGTAPHLPPQALGPVDYEVGVIAGSVSLNPLFSAALPGANDGKVTVARTRVDGLADHLVVRHSHSFLMRSRTVARQTLHFLAHGRFDRPMP